MGLEEASMEQSHGRDRSAGFGLGGVLLVYIGLEKRAVDTGLSLIRDLILVILRLAILLVGADLVSNF